MFRFGTQILRGISLLAACLLSWPAAAQFTQQAKLFAPDYKPGPLPEEGWSVAVSADGNTAIVGAPNADWTGVIPNAGPVGRHSYSFARTGPGASKLNYRPLR